MPDFPVNPPSQPPPRRRLRFTLRLLLAGITLLCIGLAIWTHRAREQHSLVQQIEKTGGAVTYGYDIAPRIVSGPSPPAPQVSPLPKWLINLLGADYFHEVIHAEVRDLTLLPELDRFRRLESLTIANQSLTDETFAPVAKLRRLKVLFVQPNAFGPVVTQIGDPSLAIMADLPKLENVLLSGSRITATGLATLATSPSLRHLDVVSYDASVDAAAAAPLQETGRLHAIIQRWSPDGGGVTVARW